MRRTFLPEPYSATDRTNHMFLVLFYYIEEGSHSDPQMENAIGIIF